MTLEIDVLKAIADSTRFEIIKLLLQRDFCVKALAKRMGVSESAISQHLKVLRDAGLVSGEKRGYFTHYSMNREPLNRLASQLTKLSEATSDSDLVAECSAE